MKKLYFGIAMMLAVALLCGTASATTITLKNADGTPGPIVMSGPGVATVGIFVDDLPACAGFQFKLILDKLTGPGTGAFVSPSTMGPEATALYDAYPEQGMAQLMSNRLTVFFGVISVVNPADPEGDPLYLSSSLTGQNLMLGTFNVQLDSGTLLADIDLKLVGTTPDSFLSNPEGATLPITWAGPITITTVVPEPATLSLLGIGLLGLLRLRRK